MCFTGETAAPLALTAEGRRCWGQPLLRLGGKPNACRRRAARLALIPAHPRPVNASQRGSNLYVIPTTGGLLSTGTTFEFYIYPRLGVFENCVRGEGLAFAARPCGWRL